MSVYVDDARNPYGRMVMSHMMADTHDELMAMAVAIGLSRRWLQHEGSDREHFDVCQEKRLLAGRMGALFVTSRDLVAVMRRKRPPPAQTGERPMTTTQCKDWCGCLSADQPRQSSSYMTALPSDNRLHAFCSCDCMLAGRPLHPVSKPPGEPTCARCGDVPADYACATCGKVFCRPCARGRCDCAAPGSALPLPGPPDKPLSRFAVFALMHDPAKNPSQRGDVVWAELELLRRDLAETRTALADAKRGQSQAELEERDLRARLAVTVGALERIAKATTVTSDEECRDCQWCGGDLLDNPHQRYVECPTDIARAALAPTGAPAPTPTTSPERLLLERWLSQHAARTADNPCGVAQALLDETRALVAPAPGDKETRHG